MNKNTLKIAMIRSYFSSLIVGGLLGSGVATAGTIGDSVANAAYSANQIKITNPTAQSGVYWFDVDGAGGLSPFTSFADLTTQGGGWTLVHDKFNSMPDMDGFSQNVLAGYGAASFRVVSTSFDAIFSSPNTTSMLNSYTWNYLFGNIGGTLSLGLNPNQFNLNTLINRPNDFSIYVRENVTPLYLATTSPAPEPQTYGMMLMGLGLMGFVARRRKSNQA
jgi:hypothetical protein